MKMYNGKMLTEQMNKERERERRDVHTEQSYYREKSIKGFHSLTLARSCLINSISHHLSLSQLNLLNLFY